MCWRKPAGGETDASNTKDRPLEGLKVDHRNAQHCHLRHAGRRASGQRVIGSDGQYSHRFAQWRPGRVRLSGISADQKRIFGVRPLNTAPQDAIVVDALREAADHGADIVVTPELSCTTRTVGLICKKLAAAGDRRPRIVIAGGSHIRVDGKRRNRLSTIYTDPSPYVVTHDKIGRYAFSVPGATPGTECVEDISRSTELRMHAGVNWSMIPLICADFLDDEVVDAVADLCPRLVIVPSMSSKTGDFERRADEVISKTQALVVVVNAPHNWFFTKVPVVVIGLPLADPAKGIIKQSPAPQAKPPHMVLFCSGQRSAGFT
jgi:predicted amidohydrolase